jgi:cyclic beta-1,2-glucan synthetase
MGCGDWNDGMNKVGELGQGESVWVGWFLLVILRDFLPLMRERCDEPAADALAVQGERLRQNLEAHAWDGQWYRRAYFDDGTPLGSQQNDECRIDSLSQSWAVMAGADPQRTRQAMESVWRQLVRPRDRLVLLLTPPFDQTSHDPGYIKGYLPGIRENGGQYTHAALWTIQAFALLGDADRAVDIFGMINPVLHAATPEGVMRYKVEPYVAAADVYGVPPHTGRGGWTWYTGSAAWMYRIALETLLGFELRGKRLAIRPKIPADWHLFEIHYRRVSTTDKFSFHNQALVQNETTVVYLDGQQQPGDSFDVVDDGQVHDVVITRGGTQTAVSKPESSRSDASASRSAASRVG